MRTCWRRNWRIFSAKGSEGRRRGRSLPPPPLSEGRLQERNDGAVLREVQFFLDRNLRLQIEHLERGAAYGTPVGMLQQGVKVSALSDDSQDIQRSVSGHQQVVTRPQDGVTGRTKLRPAAVMRFELGQCAHESIDVKIEGCDGRPFDDRGDAADEHEAHAMAAQSCKDGGKVSWSSWHGEMR